MRELISTSPTDANWLHEPGRAGNGGVMPPPPFTPHGVDLATGYSDFVQYGYQSEPFVPVICV
jgi:hypothetical protein